MPLHMLLLCGVLHTFWHSYFDQMSECFAVPARLGKAWYATCSASVVHILAPLHAYTLSTHSIISDAAVTESAYSTQL